MNKKTLALFLSLVMFTLLACSLLTGDRQPGPTEMAETQMAMLPYTTVIRSTKTSTTIFTPTLQATSPPTQTIEPAAATQENCLSWSEVTAAMAGQYQCVRGQVFTTYQAEYGTYIRFSDKPTSFYFIYLYQGSIYYYYPDLQVGDCVQAYGTILAYQGVPRIEISGTLDLCD